MTFKTPLIFLMEWGNKGGKGIGTFFIPLSKSEHIMSIAQ
jgi:hypothetical protein